MEFVAEALQHNPNSARAWGGLAALGDKVILQNKFITKLSFEAISLQSHQLLLRDCVQDNYFTDEAAEAWPRLKLLRLKQ